MLDKIRISGFADEIDTDIHKQIALLNELGVKYVEFRSANDKGVADYTIQEAQEIMKLFKENGIAVSAVGSPVGKIQITDDFEPHFETFKHVVELAKVFETKYIRMFSFFMPEDEDPEKYRDEVMNRLARFVEYAKEQDVVLLHENEKGIYGDVASRCREIFEKLYCQNFRCTFDFANFVQCRQDTLEAYDLLKDYVEYVHIKDARWDDAQVVPAGEGDGHVAEILAKLDAAGYAGFLSLEPHLAEFAALKSLEQHVDARESSDGVWSYTTAFHALKKILG